VDCVGLLGQFAAHGVNDCLVVRLAEDGGTGHEGIGAGLGGCGDVLDFDAAVDFSMMSRPDSSMRRRTAAIFFSASGIKDWPPKPGLTDMIKMISILSIT